MVQEDSTEIERAQKATLHIMLGEDYLSYKNALQSVILDTLESRRGQNCLKFTKKAAKHPKHHRWFKANTMNVNNKQEKTKYCKVAARTIR